MKYAQMRRHTAYEALCLQGIMAMIAYLTRMWPFLLLVMISALITGLELIYWANQSVEPAEPVLRLVEPSLLPSETDVQAMAYHVIQMRVTQFLQKKYPDVRWVWENPRAREAILAGDPVYVLLNRAGGYRRAQVIIQNLQVVDVLIEGAPYQPQPIPDPVPNTGNPTDPATPEPSSPETGVNNNGSASRSTEAATNKEAVPEDYSLIAFQWVEAHIMDLNDQYNEAIAHHLPELLLDAEQLPVQESWPEICKELERNELPGAICREDGIHIKIQKQ